MQSYFSRLWHQKLRRPYTLYYRTHGASGPIIVLLHGIAASSDKWGALTPLLEGSYRCITVDLLGFGKSPKPQWMEYWMEDHVRSLHKTLKQLGLHQDYILVGHSLGSLLATHYARQHPRHISRLVLLSPPIYPPLSDIKGRLARGRTALFLRIYKFLRSHPRMTPTNFKRLSHILPLPKSVIRHPATWTPFMRTLEHCIEQQTIQQDISDLSMAIDIFYGSLDQVVIGENLEAVASLIGVEVHKVRGVNHDLHPRYARAVARHLLPGTALAARSIKKDPGKKLRSSRKPHTS